jgi:predicted MFS family arabinose efflux permease
MFWVGLLPGLLAFWIQGHVSEPDIFERTLSKKRTEPASNFLQIFSPSLLKVTVLASLVALGAQGGYYAFTTWLPLYMAARGLSVMHTGGYLLVVIAGSFAGYMTAAYLTDRIGRKWTLAIFSVLSFTSVLFYMAVPISNHIMLFLGFPLGFFPSGTFSPMGSFFSELFPTSVRGSGQGFVYNLGRGVGALFPTLVGYFSAHMRLGYAIAIFSVAAYTLTAISVLFLPETRGRKLPE